MQTADFHPAGFGQAARFAQSVWRDPCNPVTLRRVDDLEVVALADDLSGAAETAAAFVRCAADQESPAPGSVRLQLWQSSPAPGQREAAGDPADGPVVVDTDSRQLTPHAARRRIHQVLEQLRPHVRPDRPERRMIKKIDSLLRGNLAAELEPLMPAGIVLAAALPAAGRTVRRGAVLVDGRPLASVDSWRAEPGAAPRTIADAIAPLPSVTLPLDLVRGPAAALADHLATVGPNRVAICDAESDDDLDRIVTAAWQVRAVGRRSGARPVLAGPVLAGTAAIAAAVARKIAPNLPDHNLSAGRIDDRRPLLAVIGSADPRAREQLARLSATGLPTVVADPAQLLGDPATVAANVITQWSGGVTAVAVGEPVTPDRRTEIAAALAEAVGRLRTEADLVLIGGETGRRVLDRVGIGELRLLGPVVVTADQQPRVEYGAVASTAPDGRMIITRPGSFGDADSLIKIISALRGTAGFPTLEGKR